MFSPKIRTKMPADNNRVRITCLLTVSSIDIPHAATAQFFEDTIVRLVLADHEATRWVNLKKRAQRRKCNLDSISRESKRIILQN